MKYYRVKPVYDQKSRCDGSVLIANELYTSCEMAKFHISEKYTEPVEISRKAVYFFFGARFAHEGVAK